MTTKSRLDVANPLDYRIVVALILLVIIVWPLPSDRLLSLDDLLSAPSWGLPYAFRIPAAFMLLGTVAINWCLGERAWRLTMIPAADAPDLSRATPPVADSSY